MLPYDETGTGKPVVLLWGLGLRDRPWTPAQAEELIRFFKSDPIYGGAYLIGGIDPYWRSLFADAEVQAGWADGKNGTRIELDQASHKTLVLPNIPEWPQLQEALDLGLSQAYVKQATPRDALGSVAQAWTQTLQGAGYGAAGKPLYTPQT